MYINSFKIFILLFAVFAISIAVAQLTGRLPVKGVRFPVEHYADGTVKMELYADQAFIDADNQNVDATGIKVLMFNENSQENGLILATNCFYSKATNLLTSADAIFFKKQSTTVTGIGYELNIKSNKFKILNDAKMVINDVEEIKSDKLPINLRK
jgi:lipopolysaccharide export system protein LptC